MNVRQEISATTSAEEGTNGVPDASTPTNTEAPTDLGDEIYAIPDDQPEDIKASYEATCNDIEATHKTAGAIPISGSCIGLWDQ